jgi:excisionase family DNA binding protein
VSDEPFNLANRLALSVAEAASVLGVAENTLRTILSEIPHLHVGRRVVIPVEPFKEWLASQAKAGQSRVDSAVEEILSDFHD